MNFENIYFYCSFTMNPKLENILKSKIFNNNTFF